MKTKILLILSLFFIGNSYAQTDYCGADNFYDNGGSAGNYTSSTGDVTTIFPDIPGDLVTATFNSFAVEGGWDGLMIYDGPDASSPLISSGSTTTSNAATCPIGSWNGNFSPVGSPITSTHATGALTFVFTADGSVFQAGFDVTITCNPPPTCQQPTLPVTSAITTTSAHLDWDGTNSSIGFWYVEYGPAGYTPGSGTSLMPGVTLGAGAGNDTAFIGGLTPGTDYDWYVSNICTPGSDSSMLTGPISFFTPPDYCGGSHFYDNGGVAGNYLVTPTPGETTTIFPDLPGDLVTATFNSFNTESGWDGLMIYDGPDASSPLISSGSTFNRATCPNGAWTGTGAFAPTVAPFTSTHPTGALTFVFTADGGVAAGWDATISCNAPPTCPQPYTPSAITSAITTTSAHLDWDGSVSTIGLWYVEYGPAGYTPGTGTQLMPGMSLGVGVGNDTALLTGLTPDTSYDWYVSNVCTPGSDTSFLTGPINFTTPPDYCGGDHFYDNGGVAGNYLVTATPGQTTTIFADMPGDLVTATFNSFNTENGWDGLMIYDGPDASSPLISSGSTFNRATCPNGAWTGTGAFAPSDPFTSTHPTGALTFVFTADGGVAAGWDATISCNPPPTCPQSTSLVGTGITDTTVDLSWNSTSIALDWIIEYGPAGFIPGSGTSVIVNTNPYTLTGLTGSTLYDVYVRDSCLVDDISFYSDEFSFGTPCGVVAAPYYYSFDGNLNLPYCWSTSGTEPWLYNPSLGAGPDYGVAGSVDHTTGTGNYAWIDGSGFPSIGANELVTPSIDYSGLTQGIVGCWILSNNVDDVAQNNINLEGFNGTTWDVLATYSGNNEGWIRFYTLIPANLPDTTTFRLVQSEGALGGSAFNNDILVDDFFVEEAPTCINPTNLSDSIVSPTLVELSWTTGGATDWIIEYGPTGFLPGTGAGTLVNTDQNPHTLTVEPGQDYDWYVQDSCAADDISWHSYVNDFRMPGEVDCDSAFTNFTYCYSDNEEELYTYQSTNSAGFLHLVFNAGVLASNDDFIIYDGPDNTYPIMFATLPGSSSNMTGLEFTSTSNIITFSFNTIGFPNTSCTTPLDFDINCCENTTFNQIVHVCVDSSFTLPDGVVVSAQADYTSIIPNAGGCDSIITTSLKILADSTTSTDVICVGVPYMLPNGTTTTIPDNYQMVVSNYLGCDSAVNLTLVSAQPSSSTRDIGICTGESHEMPDGTFVNATGPYSIMYTNAAGCDSTYTVNLTVNLLTTESETVLICEGDFYTLYDGVIVTTPGDYTSLTLNDNGCQLTVTTTLTVADGTFSSDTVEICGVETYTLLNGDVVSDAGEYNVNVGNVFNCDSIVTVYLSKCIASGITGEEGNAVSSIFPNPSSRLINITFNTNNITSDIDVKVMNALGQEIDFIENVSDSNLVINVSTYSNGMYYLVVNDDSNTSIKKFVVSK